MSAPLLYQTQCVPQVAGCTAIHHCVAVESDKNHDGFVNDEVRAAIDNGCDGLNVSGVKGRINAFQAVNGALTSR
jgi:hypothetical protein